VTSPASSGRPQPDVRARHPHQAEEGGRVKGSHILTVAVFILVGVLCFSRLGAYSLAGSGARYAAIAREMAESYDFVTPRLNGIKHFDKPPFVYWVTSLGYYAFGYNEFGARFFLGVFALATCAVTGYLALRLWGRAAAAAAVFCLGTSLGFVGTFHVLTTDAFLVFFNTLALATFYLAHRFGERWCRVAFFVSLGMSFLVKGPIGPLTVLAVILVFLVITNKLGAVRRMGWSWGLPLAVLIAGPWVVAICLQNPGLLRYFFVEQLLGRVYHPVMGHVRPWYHFLIFAPVLLLPWVFLVPPALREAWRRFRKSQDDSGLFAATWLVVPVILFSLPSTKLVLYVAGIVPAGALLCARWASRVARHGKKRMGARAWFVLCGLGLLALGVFIAAALATGSLPQKLAEALAGVGTAWPVVLVSASCMIVAVSMVVLAWHGRLSWAFALAPVPFLVMLILGAFYVKHLPLTGLKRIAAEIESRRRDGDAVAVFHCSADGLGFYVNQRIVEVPGNRDVRFEEDDSHHDYLLSRRRFSHLWKKPRRIWCVVRPGNMEMIIGRVFVVTEHPNYVLTTNKPLQ